jgi:hypothetical protein
MGCSQASAPAEQGATPNRTKLSRSIPRRKKRTFSGNTIDGSGLVGSPHGVESHSFQLVEEISMKHLLLTVPVLLCGAAWCSAAEFEPPVRLKAGGAPIRVEAPGYAAPCLDGKQDLYVGQFNKGKIKVYKNLGKGNFAEGVWLQAGGKDAEVPGVW